MGIDDWELHLSSVFTEVRSYAYIEVRSADLGQPTDPRRPGAVDRLLYDDAALTAALELGQGHDSHAAWRAAMDAAARQGLQGTAGGHALRDLAAETLALAVASLRSRGREQQGERRARTGAPRRAARAPRGTGGQLIGHRPGRGEIGAHRPAQAAPPHERRDVVPGRHPGDDDRHRRGRGAAVVEHEAEQVIDVGGLVRHVIVHNREFERGMLSSVQAGIKALPHGTTAFLLWPVDQPLVRADTVDRLIEGLEAAARAGRGARPPREAGAPDAVLDQALRGAPECPRERGSEGAVVHAHEEALVEVEVDDAGILTDIDTPQAYHRKAFGRDLAPEAAPVRAGLGGITALTVLAGCAPPARPGSDTYEQGSGLRLQLPRLAHVRGRRRSREAAPDPAGR